MIATPTQPETVSAADLSALLSKLSRVQDELLQALREKRTALASADLPALAKLHEREASLQVQLQECQCERAAMLTAAAQQGSAAESLGKLAEQFTSSEGKRLSEQVKDSAAKMRLLQHQSLTNWVAAQRSLLYVSQLIDIVASGGQSAPTYGDSEPVRTHGSLIDHEA